MAFNNFTVSIVTFPEFEGVDFTIAHPQAVLLLTPASGYSVTASDFSATAPLPNYVSTVVFTQTGLNVSCTITYIAPSIMPAADVLVAVCSSGFASLIPVTLSGSLIACDVQNTTITLPVAYSSSGVYNSTSTILTQVVSASAGYYFDTAPFIAVTTGSASNYTITEANTLNAEGQLISVTFTINYLFPLLSIASDQLCLTAIGSAIYNPGVSIQSYSLPLTSETILIGGQTNTITISGINGATWAFTAVNSGSTVIATDAGTIDSTGYASVIIVFPATIANEVYTLTLTGAGVAGGVVIASGQASVIVLGQYIETNLGFGFSSTDARFLPINAPILKTFIPFQNVPSTQTYTMVANSTEPIVLLTQPGTNDWSDGGGGYFPTDLTYNSFVNKATYTIVNVANPGISTLTAKISVTIDQAGTPSLNRYLNLDNYVEQAGLTPISLYTGATSTDACCGSTSGSFFISSSETFLTATAILLADGTTSAPDQIYRYLNDYRTQTGGSLVAGSTACSSCRTGITLCYSTTLNNTCCGTSAAVVVYIPNGETFDSASVLYANSTGSTVAAQGYYSDDTNTCNINLF